MLVTSEMGNVQLLNKPGSLLPRNKNFRKKLASIFLKYIQGQIYAKSTNWQEYKMYKML